MVMTKKMYRKLSKVPFKELHMVSRQVLLETNMELLMLISNTMVPKAVMLYEVMTRPTLFMVIKQAVQVQFKALVIQFTAVTHLNLFLL